MFYRILVFGFLLLPSVMRASWFAHDRAALKAQHGDWAGAKTQLTQALVDASDDSAVLYDAGVASYKTGDFSQAAAYFKRASTCDSCLAALKEQTHFNWGNTCVQQKELAAAIEQYEAVLKMNPKNEPARHNLAVVKKMLEQQKQQQDNKHDKPQDKNEQNKQDQKENKQSQNEKQQDQQQKQDQKQDAQNTQSDARDQQSEQEKKREQDQQQKQDAQDNSQQKQDTQEQQRGQSAKQDKNEQGKRQQQEQPDNEREQKQQVQAGKESEEQHDPAQVAAGEQTGAEKKLTGFMAQLLKEQEKRDAQVNKRLIQAQVSKKMSGENGQNCW